MPGDVHWDLERSGKIPPIYYGLNSQKIGWVAGKEWWYRKSFRTPPQWQGKTVRLRFDGVDYLADVWLNGQHLGRHEGQFTPFEYDVTKLLRRDKENVLAVLIHPGPESVRKAIAAGQAEWPVMGVVRAAYPYWKAATTAGWDWGVKIIAMGIWKDVRLLASEDVYLADPIVLPKLSAPYDEATLETRLNGFGRKTAIGRTELSRAMPDRAGSARGRFAKSRLLRPAAGRSRLRSRFRIRNCGGPTVTASSTSTNWKLRPRRPTAARNCTPCGQPSASATCRCSRIPSPTTQVSRLSGIMPRATQGIFPMPKDVAGAQVFDADQRPADFCAGRQLDSLRFRSTAGRESSVMSILSVRRRKPISICSACGAAASSKKPDFRELCDRYGIMLFQEFWGGPRLKETDAALAISARETREILPLLMNHPSVVRYGGGNEMYLNARNSRQMAQLRAICNQLDPTRPFHDPDPETMFQRHGDYWYDDPRYFYSNYRPAAHQRQRAGQSDGVERIRRGRGRQRRVARGDDARRGPLARPCQTRVGSGTRASTATARTTGWECPGFTKLFGPSPDLPTLVRHSQFVQAEGLRYACQSMRRFRWHRSACALWVYNEPWPNAAHDAIVEYYGRKPMAYYYVKQAYAPVDVLAVYSSLEAPVGNPLAVELWATNDDLQPLAGYRCRYRITDVARKALGGKADSGGSARRREHQDRRYAVDAADRRWLATRCWCGWICSTPGAKPLPNIFTLSACLDTTQPPLLADHAQNAANGFEVANAGRSHA